MGNVMNKASRGGAITDMGWSVNCGGVMRTHECASSPQEQRSHECVVGFHCSSTLYVSHSLGHSILSENT